jgi:hypothetical protein
MTTGYVRSTTIPAYAQGSSNSLQLTERGELLIAEGLPRLVDLVRQGSSWVKLTDEVACVNAALPTTTAPHTIWNGEPAGGKTYIIDRLNWTCTTSAGAAGHFSMCCMLNAATAATQVATADTATAVTVLDGKAYSGNLKTSHTCTVVNDGWFTVGGVFETALTATVGCQLDVLLPTPVLLRPGGRFSVGVVAVNATAKGILSVFGHEIQLPVVLS